MADTIDWDLLRPEERAIYVYYPENPVFTRIEDSSPCKDQGQSRIIFCWMNRYITPKLSILDATNQYHLFHAFLSSSGLPC
ncbi:hypothetical protein PILCRDRAFT_822607 [Piloderma croceum F 1598]|uniref:Uncharacterized protein n=1 Tax=Piloderma croceum (strain F 1598) TaxID=765440 RepID=A0A0C3BT31_PILCF|nr:hypothetical protein PILCRDRAFT_822607 [Piloderma croceum F 1598]